MKILRSYQGAALLILVFSLIACSTITCGSGYRFYRVKSGDTISVLAGEFQLSAGELLSLNQIGDPDLIFAGQLLRIPAAGIDYRVVEGDSLWKIAMKHELELEEILAVNQLEDQDIIRVGQVLRLPAGERERYSVAARSVKSNFIWPALGQISSEYGWRVHPVTGEREFHHGLDIALPLGSPVHAAGDGVVSYTGYTKGYGNLMIIQHRDKYLTYYAHNFKLLVEEGQQVSQGKIIALSGNSGLSTGPHLHFEIRVDKRTVNPLQFLNQWYLLSAARALYGK